MEVMDDLRKEVERLNLENESLRRQLRYKDEQTRRESGEIGETSDCLHVANHEESNGLKCRENLPVSRGVVDVKVEEWQRPCSSARQCSVFMSNSHTLSAEMVRRYSRQLLVPLFGVKGQEKLSKSSALIVGVGGLGSPIALYLAAAGVGCLGLADHDVVELNNLHRQVIHKESCIGETKVKSAAATCHEINSSVHVVEHSDGLKPSNALEIISKYDIILDATDNLSTRYLINDACVATGKPLVSGAALGLEGQLSVYHHNNGPCYRCLFPIPPPRAAHQRCSDSGVLGIVPGIIGCLQALEAVKLASGMGEPLSGQMLILDVFSTRIHIVKLRGKSPDCIVCGDHAQITCANLHQYDYENFTDAPLSDKTPARLQILPEGDGITCKELAQRLDEEDQGYVLLDVRERHEFAITSIPSSINIPFSHLNYRMHLVQAAIYAKTKKANDSKDMTLDSEIVSSSQNPIPPLYVVCRRGNDSQQAVKVLREAGFCTAVDVVGGLESWAREVNSDLPAY